MLGKPGHSGAGSRGRWQMLQAVVSAATKIAFSWKTSFQTETSGLCSPIRGHQTAAMFKLCFCLSVLQRVCWVKMGQLRYGTCTREGRGGAARPTCGTVSPAGAVWGCLPRQLCSWSCRPPCVQEGLVVICGAGSFLLPPPQDVIPQCYNVSFF